MLVALSLRHKGIWFSFLFDDRQSYTSESQVHTEQDGCGHIAVTNGPMQTMKKLSIIIGCIYLFVLGFKRVKRKKKCKRKNKRRKKGETEI